MVTRSLLLLASTLLILAPVAAAVAAPADAAKEEFDTGNRYFEVQEYEAALPHFKKAYELSGKRPSTVFALAQCERALALYDDAIAHFREYLEAKPKPKDAKAVANTIKLLEEKRALAQAPVVAPPPPPPATAPPPPSPVVTASAAPARADLAAAPPPPPEDGDEGTGWGTIVLIGAGVAAVAGGAVALGVALSAGPSYDVGTTGVVLER